MHRVDQLAARDLIKMDAWYLRKVASLHNECVGGGGGGGGTLH